MNEYEIRELFIRGAMIDNRLPNAPRPARLKSQSLPFIHSFEDRAGWGAADYSGGDVVTRKDRMGRDIPLTEAERLSKKKSANDRLEFDDRGRYDIEKSHFWDGDRITPAQVSEWEQCNELIRLVSREKNRRCLWAYVRSQAKTLYVEEEVGLTVTPSDGIKRNGKSYQMNDFITKRMSFSKWCAEVEGVHRNYGKLLVDHAIAEIAFKLASKLLQPNDKGVLCTLQLAPQISDITAKMRDDAPRSGPNFTPGGWVVQNKARAMHRFDEGIIHYDMSDVRKKQRRQREARKREAA